MGIRASHRRGLILSTVVWLGVLSGNALAQCAEDRVDLRGDWGSARFTVELADDARERGIGLMHRESMPLSAGMLFAYEEAQQVSFWMRNTLIPLDMIFMDATGRVTHIHENAIPLDETGISGGEADVQYVLEINGGLAGRMGIEVGSELRHPAIGPNAAWVCD